jgi:DNA-binding transcriptional LysR family regulator
MALTSTQFAGLFRSVVVNGNYTRAARQLGVTPAAVSKAVAKQEALLGVQLLRRTTRSMKPTESGARYYEKCCQALALLEAAEQSLAAEHRQPSGQVRISVPTTYGHYRVLPWLPSFLRAFPRIRVEVGVSNENVDFVADGFDLAVRMGQGRDSALLARKLEDAELGVFASPEYIATYGQPSEPGALAQHRCITFTRPSTGRPLPWVFLGAKAKLLELHPRDALCCSGDVLGCVTLARNGAGLVQAYRYVVADDVRHGRLLEVLQPYSGRTSRFSLLRSAHQAQSRAAQPLADELVLHCATPRR